MAIDESVTEWLSGIKLGDANAAERLCERYFDQLVQFARPRINRRHRALASEEDVAQSVLNIFCIGARRGRFGYVLDRSDLWSLLVRITVHKVIDYYRRYDRAPSIPRELRESDIESRRADINAEPFLTQVAIEHRGEPVLFTWLQEEFELLMGSLRNDEARTIAIMKMQGNSTREIATAICKSPRSVERKLRSIRKRWEETFGDGAEESPRSSRSPK